MNYVSAQRPDITTATTTAGTTATSTTPPPALTLSDIGDLLRHADSENCDYAASALAGPCADFDAGTLLDLLSGLPAEVPLRALLDKLADALVRRNVANPAVWNDMLHLIKSNPKPGRNQLQLDQVAHFAECLASLKVTDLNVWSELTAALPPSDSTRHRAHCGAMIARALTHAGVEAPVVWDALLASLIEVHAEDGYPYVYTAVVTSFERGAVNDTAAWKALWRTFEASGPGFQDVEAVQHMFTRCFRDCPDEMARMVSLFEELKLAGEVAGDLVRRNVVNPADWIDLLHRIKSNPNRNPRAGERLLAQIDHCAQCLASLQVTDLAVWSEVAGLPTVEDYSMHYGETIAGSMARAGVKAPAVWDTLIASLVDANAGSLAAYASVATCLEDGVAVSDTAAWKALWRHFEASGPSLGQVMAMQSFAKCFSECPDELARMDSLSERLRLAQSPN